MYVCLYSDLKVKLNVKICILVETKMQELEAMGVLPYFGFTGSFAAPTENYMSGMFILCDRDEIGVAGAIIEPGIVQMVFSLKRSQQQTQPPCVLTAVYADHQSSKRLKIWDNMEATAKVAKVPILAVGDFNAIKGREDKIGGATPSEEKCSELQQVMDKCQLEAIEPAGDRFTWTNKRQREELINEQIDHAFANQQLGDQAECSNAQPKKD